MKEAIFSINIQCFFSGKDGNIIGSPEYIAAHAMCSLRLIVLKIRAEDYSRENVSQLLNKQMRGDHKINFYVSLGCLLLCSHPIQISHLDDKDKRLTM